MTLAQRATISSPTRPETFRGASCQPIFHPAPRRTGRRRRLGRLPPPTSRLRRVQVRLYATRRTARTAGASPARDAESFSDASNNKPLRFHTGGASFVSSSPPTPNDDHRYDRRRRARIGSFTAMPRRVSPGGFKCAPASNWTKAQAARAAARTGLVPPASPAARALQAAEARARTEEMARITGNAEDRGVILREPPLYERMPDPATLPLYAGNRFHKALRVRQHQGSG